MHRHTRKILALLVLVLLLNSAPLLGAEPPQPPQDIMATARSVVRTVVSNPRWTLGPPRVALACFDGTFVPQPHPRCLRIIVLDEQGQALRNQSVTIEYEGQTVKLRTRHVLGLPSDVPAAPYDVSKLGADLTDIVQIRTRTGSSEQRVFVAVAPDPDTLMQDVIISPKLGELGYPPIAGMVSHINKPTTPISGALVTLVDISGTEPVTLGTTLTSPRDNYPAFYGFNPETLAAGARLRLVAQHESFVKSFDFTWERQPVFIPLMFGSTCTDILPFGGHGDELPTYYCLVVTAKHDGEAVELANVSVTISTTTVATYTQLYTASMEPLAVFQIGDLMDQLPPTATVRIIGEYDGFVGMHQTTLGHLRQQSPWEGHVALTLVGQFRGTTGLTGGVAVAVAAVDSTWYAVLPGGGVLVQYDRGMPWMPLPGNGDDLFPSPESAGMVAVANGRHDTLLAFTRNGELAYSPNGGQRWYALSNPSLPPLRALAAVSSGRFYGVSDTQLFEITVNSDYSLIYTPTATLERRPTSLAVRGEALLIGDDQGVVRHAPDGSRSTMYEGEVSALLPIDDQLTLLGTPEGLLALDADGGTTPYKLPWPVYSLARPSASDETILAATPLGIFEGRLDVAATWTQVTEFELPMAETIQTIPFTETLGSPISYDAGRHGTTLYQVTSAGVFVSSTNGATWRLLASLPELPARSITVISTGYLAATPQALWFLPHDKNSWQKIGGLSLPLNASIVRAHPTDGRLLLGAGPGSPHTLYMGSISSLPLRPIDVGQNLGVTGLAWLPVAMNSIDAVIGTDGEGVFALGPGDTLTQLPPLPGAGSANARISTVAIETNPLTGQCLNIVVGTFAPQAQIVRRACDVNSNWLSDVALPTDRGQIGFITDIEIAPDGRYFATTDRGLLIGHPGSGWDLLEGTSIYPLSVVATPSYTTTRDVLLVGMRGTLLFNDSSPDLTIEVAGETLLVGAETYTFTVTVRNLGLLTSRPTQLSYEVPHQKVDIESFNTAVPALAAGEVFQTQLVLTVKPNVRPDIDELKLKVAASQGERFTANNQIIHKLRFGFRVAPDLSLGFSGDQQVVPGAEAEFLIFITSRSQITATGALVEVTFPASLTLGTPSQTPSLEDGQRLQWTIAGPLPYQSEIIIRVPYTPTGQLGATALTIAGVLTPTGDDRDDQNNQAQLSITQRPSTPEVLVLIASLHMTGPTDAFNTQLAEYRLRSNAFVLDLDTIPATRELRKSLDGLWAQIMSLRASGKPFAKEGERYLQLFDQYTLAIDTQIWSYATAYPSLKYLYILGDDYVIPGYAKPHEAGDLQVLSESEFAPAIDPSDPMHLLIQNNRYFTDRPYEEVTKTRFLWSGRQIGTAPEMAVALASFNLLKGKLRVPNAYVDGTAELLTEDIQEQICLHLQDKGWSLSCDTIQKLITPSFLTTAGGAYFLVYSGHGDVNRVNDLTNITVINQSFQSANLLLLLACHGGLSPIRQDLDSPSLIAALSGKAMFVYAYTSYVLAASSGTSTAKMNTVAYGELLNWILAGYLTNEDITAGYALYRAREQYIKQRSSQTYNTFGPLDEKTIDSLRFYGPPNLIISRHALSTTETTKAPASYAGVTNTMELIPSWQTVELEQGTIFIPTVEDAMYQPLVAYGRTMQPSIVFEVAPEVKGVHIIGADYHDLYNINPLIPLVAPLSGFDPYSEQLHSGKPHDWKHAISIYTDSMGRRWVQIPLGEWHEPRQRQRIYDRVRILLVRSQGNSSAQLAPLDVTACLTPDQATKVEVHSTSVLDGVDLLVDANGSLRQVPLVKTADRWEVNTVLPQDATFSIQATGTDGSVYVELNGGALYAPTNARCR